MSLFITRIDGLSLKIAPLVKVIIGDSVWGQTYTRQMRAYTAQDLSLFRACAMIVATNPLTQLMYWGFARVT